MYKLLVISFLALFGGSVGQVYQEGLCDPNISLEAEFSINNFTGTWYEISNAHSFPGDCASIELTNVDDRLTVLKKTTRENFYQEHTGNVSIGDNPAQLSFNITTLSSNPIDFWVIHTDYSIYALVYGCENVGTTHRNVHIWMLGRETSYPNLWIELNLGTILNNLLGIQSTQLRPVSHSDNACYQLPVLEPGQAVVLPGQCNSSITGVSNFSAPDFLGVWHEIQSYYSPNVVGGCSRAQYSDGGDRVLVVNSQIINQSLLTIEGYATVNSSDGSGQLGVVLEVAPGIFAEEQLLVLGTDYNQWAVTYTCQNVTASTRQIFSWVVSRTRQLSASAQAEVDQVISSFVELNNMFYEPTDQTDAGCFYIPERTDVNEPLIFGGQCDQSINVVSNFSAVDYMGLWHEIEKYPTPFQFGECSNAYYSLGDAGVDVFNTQVFNEALLTINGVAVPVADGKLVVTFPIEGTNLTTDSDYWVLRTNYTSFALVYSCTNINDYQQQVTFWKLSRTKQLTTEAQSQINEVFSQIQVLNQEYFLPTDQSEAACFYYPEPQPGVPVVFPGSCEANVSVVPNFNLTAFQGVWYEVEAYPKDPQEGQCIDHTFTSPTFAGTDTATFNFVSTSVNEQLLTSVDGQLTLYPNENGGRFTLSFVSNGTTISFPYYVIATDYNDYALVYSCLDISNSDFRGIWAWKLSRTKDLSINGFTQINNVIASNPTVTLRNEYFEPIDQSDDACFYFPDLAAGAPVILPGSCDTANNIPYVRDFNITAYLGRWRLIESYPYDDGNSQCKQATYVEGPDGSLLIQANEVVNQLLVEIDATATLTNNASDGIINVVFPNTPEPTFPIYILDTDYESYSLVYGCINLVNQQRRVFSFKLSRNTSLSTEAINAIDAVTSNVLVLNDRYYQSTDQSDNACFYYPELGSGPTIFRGQCNESIPVVTNFNAVDYMGLWHAIESYPMPFQDGTCHNAEYTFNELLGRVDVFNTQVINQSLDTIEGYAVPLPSEDGSAKLNVTFPSLGPFVPSSPYWVLATDYTTFALVYSCQNTDTEHRSVSSWKLSRTKVLPTAAANVIQGIVNSTDVLDDRYFIDRNQTAGGCFYYPEPQPGVPVVYPGSCEANVPVVPNFNVTAFQGVWYEVEAYPKDPQEGQCIDHTFSAGTGTAAFNFLSTSVDEQLLTSVDGQLTLYPNQNDGRFTLSFVSNGTTFSFPYYVIATDYDDYALIYSCLDIRNSDFRGIWAWKLSRTKDLSINGFTQINNVIASNPTVTLRNDYFEPIDQSDDACFYFPDLAAGAPVILPGLCDTADNIPYIRDFNITAYLGRWRLIESYPYDDGNSQCKQATYVEGPDGNLLIQANEVVNQLLVEIDATATLTNNASDGIINVVFPNTPEPTFPIYILDTDYESYSLVYGCINLINQQRRVFSFKLSRNTSLSNEAINAIDAVTSNVLVLNERYYQSTDQSDNACFYYPELGSGPTIFRGQCNESIPVVTNFNAVDYVGLWHAIESYPMPFQDGTCHNAEYTFNELLGRVDVFNTQVINQSLDTIEGYAVPLPSEDGSAKLNVTFPSLGPFVPSSPYWVLATDYTTFALVYSCQNTDTEHRSVSSWKLSRTKVLPTAAANIIQGIVNSTEVLDDRYFIDRNQTAGGCFYDPEPQPGVPVVYPGQCDDNIDVVQDFQLSRFSGVWHEVEAYPKIQQTGDCVNHNFTISTAGNSLDLLSYNVDAQSLGITQGSLQYSSNDGSARFTITFNSSFNGTVQTIPYWIIDTDYDNYALAYACENNGTDFRGIWSWKLSRTKQLRPVDSTAIDNAIANIDVLGNQYYEPVNQTDEACFFYPEHVPGRPVVFPGRCADISGLQNFNATRYLGLWRTIESYPSPSQVGTCSDAHYSLGDGVVVVYNTEVVDETLSTIFGTAVPATDGTGKLYVQFPNTPVVEYYVLDTDYETYALVYSCIDSLNSDERSVFSWKLGREHTLPAPAEVAINNTIDSIDVLDQRYYEVMNRSLQGCFYFPEHSDDMPVVFRGRCDQNVTVHPNFNASDYIGRWYSIYSYPAQFQDGTCARADYELDTLTGLVNVVNTQVLNQVLDIQAGTAYVVDNAKLSVTFNISGQEITSDLWILSTDYTNYSFVYSCSEIDSEYKLVNSWKLSRSQILPEAAVPIINNIINNVQVLDERYFVEEGHTEDDCFFYPDNNGGDVILNGQCVPDNEVPAIAEFDVTRFSGTWHEVSRFPQDLQEGECATSTLTAGNQGVFLTQTIVDDELQTTSVIPATLDANGRGVIYPPNTNESIPFDALYILATDYDDYALIYGCREVNETQKQVYSWQLARSRSGFSATSNDIIEGIVSENIDLFETYYEDTEQTNDACFYYPEYDTLPEVIELPGPCDTSITGVPDFNAGDYTGLWLEIERYPQPFQFGTCDRAYYSAGDGNVIVRNTQVINEAISEQLGTAIPAADNTGLLNVTFNVDGVIVTANYYILATDYTNYALVYSCRDVNVDGEETSLVSSWKLSRTTTLSPQAQSEIDATIARTRGLNPDYYKQTSQSVEDCFYIPEVDANSAPLFRGQCGTVSGVNLDVTRFAGWWHELERYPIDDIIGQCISSRYTTSGAGYQVVDTSVANGEADIVTGTVTVSDGRLTRVLSNGVTQEIVVLATDYDNYALLYSCEDVFVNGEDYRRVWSAKHSRNRDLSSVNVDPINQIIIDSDVLYTRFYQEVTQTDEACFHYPEVQDQRVILPGQCDKEIPVVEGFDVVAYQGTWYQIERYPQVHENQDATCIGARYILNEAAGEVDVLNWQVVDGELDTIEGIAVIASEDGSAKLDVTLETGDDETVATSLYVLATDYDTYSLVYSCSNINDFQRSVGAWKLSRDRALDDDGVAAINVVVNQREELDARYFRSVEHTDDCPEPSGGVLVTSSLVVMLLCVVVQLLY